MFPRTTLVLLAALGCLSATRLALASSESDDEDEKANIPQQVSGAFLIQPNAVNVRRLPTANQRVFLFSEGRLGQKVGDGECATLAQRALESATGRPFRVTSVAGIRATTSGANPSPPSSRGRRVASVR